MNKNTLYPTINVEQFLKENWTAEEKKNVETVLDFFQHLMNEHDFDYTLNTYAGNPYTQHNRSIPNEIEGLISYVKTMTKRFPEYSFDVKNVFADGDYVVLHSHTTLKASHRGNEKKGYIITDTFKLNNGKLSEHWDAIQPIDYFSRLLFLMIGGKIDNNNPTF